MSHTMAKMGGDGDGKIHGDDTESDTLIACSWEAENSIFASVVSLHGIFISIEIVCTPSHYLPVGDA